MKTFLKKVRYAVIGPITGLALAGGAYGSSHWLITSRSQIKPSVLKSLEGARGATGVAGPQGLPGPASASVGASQGPQGIQGTTGPAGGFDLDDIHYREAPSYSNVPTGETLFLSAQCNDGEFVIGGGNFGSGVEVVESFPDHSWKGANPTDDTWNIEVTGTGTYGGSVEPYAICTSGN
jgi:hypothetical protein